MEMFVNLGLDVEEDKNYESVIAGLESVLVTNDKNLHVARHAFQSRVQLPEEYLDTWLADLKNLAKLAEYNCDKCIDARLLQQVVSGVYKPQTRQMLFDIGPGLTLNRAARVIRATEFGQTRFTPIHVEDTSNVPCPEESIAEMYTESFYTTNQTLDQEGSNVTEPERDLQLLEEQPDSTTRGVDTTGSRKAESEKSKSSLNDTEYRQISSVVYGSETRNPVSPTTSPALSEIHGPEISVLNNSISGGKKNPGKRRRQKSISEDSSKKAKTSQTMTSGAINRPETTQHRGDENEFSTVILKFDVKSEVNGQGT